MGVANWVQLMFNENQVSINLFAFMSDRYLYFSDVQFSFLRQSFF